MEMEYDKGVQYLINQIQSRQIDTLIGLVKGILADNVVDPLEIKHLRQWLEINEGIIKDGPVVGLLLKKLEGADTEEAIAEVLRKFVGESSEEGEIHKATHLPVDNPPPKIEFEHRLFLLTGTFAYGKRKKCTELIVDRGGRIAKGVNQYLDYLVIGNYVTAAWKHESYGLKIKTAVKARDEKGYPLKIVTEKSWLAAAGIHGFV